MYGGWEKPQNAAVLRDPPAETRDLTGRLRPQTPLVVFGSFLSSFPLSLRGRPEAGAPAAERRVTRVALGPADGGLWNATLLPLAHF